MAVSSACFELCTSGCQECSIHIFPRLRKPILVSQGGGKFLALLWHFTGGEGECPINHPAAQFYSGLNRRAPRVLSSAEQEAKQGFYSDGAGNSSFVAPVEQRMGGLLP